MSKPERWTVRNTKYCVVDGVQISTGWPGALPHWYAEMDGDPSDYMTFWTHAEAMHFATWAARK